jgi:hypothetical protein
MSSDSVDLGLVAVPNRRARRRFKHASRPRRKSVGSLTVAVEPPALAQVRFPPFWAYCF